MKTSKPLPGSQINWNHPSAKGLICCFLFNENAGSVKNENWGVPCTIWDYAKQELRLMNYINSTNYWGDNGLYFSGDAPYYFAEAAGTGTTFSKPDLTILIRHTAYLDNYKLLFSMTNDGATDRFLCGILNPGAGGEMYIHDDINNRGTNVTATSGFYTTFWNPISDSVYIISKSQGRFLYRDGRLVGSDSYNSTGPDDVSVAAGCITLGAYRISNSPEGKYTGHMHHFYVWERVLSKDEISDLWINPYGMFEEPNYAKYYIAPSIGIIPFIHHYKQAGGL